MELLDHVFSKFLLEGVARKDILDLMEQFGLIAKFSSSKTGEKYFVPSQLKASPDSHCSVVPTRLDPCPLYVYFVSGSVPHSLFTRLVSRSVRWCSEAGPTQPPTLYQNGAWFVIEKKTVHDFVLICKKQAPVVPTSDSAIHRINHYPVDSVIDFCNTYPLDSDLSGG